MGLWGPCVGECCSHCRSPALPSGALGFFRLELSWGVVVLAALQSFELLWGLWGMANVVCECTL